MVKGEIVMNNDESWQRGKLYHGVWRPCILECEKCLKRDIWELDDGMKAAAAAYQEGWRYVKGDDVNWILCSSCVEQMKWDTE